jgi:hypothetical protein
MDLHLGFDDAFVAKDSKGKEYQLNPIQIKYRKDYNVKTLYFFQNTRNCLDLVAVKRYTRF